MSELNNDAKALADDAGYLIIAETFGVADWQMIVVAWAEARLLTVGDLPLEMFEALVNLSNPKWFRLREPPGLKALAQHADTLLATQRMLGVISRNSALQTYGVHQFINESRVRLAPSEPMHGQLATAELAALRLEDCLGYFDELKFEKYETGETEPDWLRNARVEFAKTLQCFEIYLEKWMLSA
jgi:hypothetical protein